MLKVIPPSTTWTAADLVERFGPIPLARVYRDPPPGRATERDLMEWLRETGHLFELIDGTLVEKTMGFTESVIAAAIVAALTTFAKQHDLGIVAGADGMMRLEPNQIRTPDACLVLWDSLPERKIPTDPILSQAADLIVEVISPGNTEREMAAKLHAYFEHGTRLAWYVYPTRREVHVFTSPTDPVVLAKEDSLLGGDLLPGFELSLSELFANLPTENTE